MRCQAPDWDGRILRCNHKGAKYKGIASYTHVKNDVHERILDAIISNKRYWF